MTPLGPGAIPSRVACAADPGTPRSTGVVDQGTALPVAAVFPAPGDIPLKVALLAVAHHVLRAPARGIGTIRVWPRRSRDRAYLRSELARGGHDLPADWMRLQAEAEKPFWRA